MKNFCFTVDDNIRFFKKITARELQSIFDHPYLAMLKRLHERFDLKIQLNLFYRTDGFDLSLMSAKYRQEWSEASDWLKLSFHSEYENVCPYEHSGYDEVFDHCRAVNREILRFASPASLAATTTVHYCRTTDDGLRALRDNGISGLLGLFGSSSAPRSSYGIGEEIAADIREGGIALLDGMSFASIDMIVNTLRADELLNALSELLTRDSLRIMIHEQYFYEDYFAYQPDFEKKLATVFAFLMDHGYKSSFFEDIIQA